MYITEAAHELYKLQNSYRHLALCEDPAIAEEANHKANDAQRLILKLVDIENAILDMRSDYEETCEHATIPIHEVVDNEYGVVQSFSHRPLAEAYLKKQELLGANNMEIRTTQASARAARHWDLGLILEVENDIDAFFDSLV